MDPRLSKSFAGWSNLALFAQKAYKGPKRLFKELFAGSSKLLRSKARGMLRHEAYLFVCRGDV